MPRWERVVALNQALKERVLVLDGAMGTAIQDENLSAADFGGALYEGCNEQLVLSRPEVLRGIYTRYLDAGADILKTNTFGATPLVLAEYRLADSAREINRLSAALCRELAAGYERKDGRPRFVAGAMGPTTKAISVTGGVGFEELIEHYQVQARGLLEGGADYLLLETCQDMRNVKAGLLAIEQAQQGLAPEERAPIAVSLTIEPTGTMLAGQSAEAALISLEHIDLLYIGLNCSTGPGFMTDHLRTLSKLARARTACVPNAGLPDENGHYLETPALIAGTLLRFGQEGWLNLIGGCCGTTAAHIAALAEVAGQLAPRQVPTARRNTLSGIDALEIADDTRPLIVAERTNVLGSKKFRDLIREERFEEAAEIGRAQVKRGAHIVDVSTQQTDRDEVADLGRLLEHLSRKVRAPLMIDSTNAKAIEEGLKLCQGKAIINSINLEDGELRFEQIVPLARRYGAALVVGCIDESGQAIKATQKLAVVLRSHELLTKKYAIAEEDLYFDPLVFPCASGDVNYTGSAVETIEAVRLIKQHLPRCKSVLGISNISFGLPGAGRETVNSVFLYHCVQAGLDLALVNSEKIERYPSIPEAERKLAEDVLFVRGEGATPDEKMRSATTAFTDHFRERKPRAEIKTKVSIDERLSSYIIEGSKDGLFADLDEKMKDTKPLDIINGPLMRGMDEVGRLFNDNQLIVAEVLQSAESMKAAVSHLEPHMDKASCASRGKILLATVKGDVHDIGKNLVEIVLANNGFEVVNLGIKVPPERLIQAAREHKPDLIGLSGLLVKSAQQMIVTAADLKTAGIDAPMLVGGAALSRNFVDRNIATAYAGTVVYARDAMSGLDLARQLVNKDSRERLEAELVQRRAALGPARKVAAVAPAAATRFRSVKPVEQPPAPQDFDRHVLTDVPLEQIWQYINPVMLYGKHLGLKSSLMRDLETVSEAELAVTEQGRKCAELRAEVRKAKEWCKASGVLRPKAVYQFFRAEGEGDSVIIRDSAGAAAMRFEFPRQPEPGGLCLADYLNGKGDSVGFFVVTAGAGVREAAEEMKKQGAYLQSHIVQALALETAEAFAEFLHAELRRHWGFPDPLGTPMLELFKARYHGKRYSFGYPACPRLEDQAPLFQLLRPETIGVELTEGFMMDPEASVSAMVFHHPEASYFSTEKQLAAVAS
jgi:5-methyltetrahydrofolate--homocysteine methyltransferase